MVVGGGGEGVGYENMKMAQHLTLGHPFLFRQSGQLSFRLFVHLNSYLGMPGDKVENEQPDGAIAMETECIDTLSQLLSVVKADGVYNVAADRTGDGSQLRYFRHLLSKLVHSPM